MNSFLLKSPVGSAARRGLALAAFPLVMALQPVARTIAAFLPIEHRSRVLALSDLGGAVLFGAAAYFVSFRMLAVLCTVGCGLGFLAFALTDPPKMVWLSLPLVTFVGALQVVGYRLVLDSIVNSGQKERAWWLLNGCLQWSSLLFASSLFFSSLLRGGSVVVCLLLLLVALTHAEPPAPTYRVGPRLALLPFCTQCALSLALSVFTISIDRSLFAGRSEQLFFMTRVLGEVALSILVGLGFMVFQKRVTTLTWVGWILVSAAPLVPWSTLVDVPALQLISGASYGSVLIASRLLLLSFVRRLPRSVQSLAIASWLCIVPIAHGLLERCGDWLPRPDAPRVLLPLAAVTLLLATGVSLLRVSGTPSLDVSAPDR